MYAILTDAAGVANCGSDGKIPIDGRFGPARILATVQEYRERFKANFPATYASWTHYGLVSSLRNDPNEVFPIDTGPGGTWIAWQLRPLRIHQPIVAPGPMADLAIFQGTSNTIPGSPVVSRFKVVLRADHNFVMALFSSEQGALAYIAETLPRYIAKGYLMDKSLVASDFEVIPTEEGKRTNGR